MTAEVQRLTGLGPVPVVAVAGHDTASAVAATPALTGNFAYLSSGTWSLMGVETESPVINADTEALNYTNEGGVDGTIRLLKNICGMWLLESCRKIWGNVPYQQLISEAEQCEAFSFLINPDDESFANPDNMEEAIYRYCREHGGKALKAGRSRQMYIRQPGVEVQGRVEPSQATFPSSDRGAPCDRRRKLQCHAEPVYGKCHRDSCDCRPV